MASLLEQYQQRLERARSNRARLTSYQCPQCNHEIHTAKPRRGDIYDSLTRCPHCDGLFWRVVDSTGYVEVVEVPETA